MIQNLIGKVFGDLTIIALDKERTRDRKTYWWFECVCGNKISIRADSLKTRGRYDCGCKDKEIVSKHLLEFDLFLLELYYENNIRRVIFQDKWGYKADLTYGKIVDNGGNFNFVDKRNPYAIQNICLWIEINKKSFELVGENFYIDSETKLKFYCKKCTDTFIMDWEHISQGYSCNLCSGKYIGKYNNLEYVYPDLVKQWLKSENNLLPSDVTFACTENVLWKCPKCEHEWWATVNCRTNKTNKSGCPKCNESKREKETALFLDNNDILYIRQYRFKDCKYKNTLPFDFHLPNYNLCIEVQGPQHFEPIEFFGGLVQFQKQLILDQIKRDYCEQNEINLLEIPYWEFDNGNAEQILIDYLNNL